MQMKQMFVIRFSRWRELGLSGMSSCQHTYQTPKLVLRTTLQKFGLIPLQGLIDGGKLAIFK